MKSMFWFSKFGKNISFKEGSLFFRWNQLFVLVGVCIFRGVGKKFSNFHLHKWGISILAQSFAMVSTHWAVLTYIQFVVFFRKGQFDSTQWCSGLVKYGEIYQE